jgi:hypothetical protein
MENEDENGAVNISDAQREGARHKVSPHPAARPERASESIRKSRPKHGYCLLPIIRIA